MDHGQGKSCETLASVTLPPLPPAASSAGGAPPPRPPPAAVHPSSVSTAVPRVAPGGAVRLPPPSPPPRPTSTLFPPPPRSSSSAVVARRRGSPAAASRTAGGAANNQQQHSAIPSAVASSGGGVGGSSPTSSLQTSLSSTPSAAHSFSSLVGGGGSTGGLRTAADSGGSVQPPVSTQNITLFTPRTVRQQNVYVDTPIKKSDQSLLAPSTPMNSIKRMGHPPPSAAVVNSHHHHHHHAQQHRLPGGGVGIAVAGGNNKSLPTVINSQPIVTAAPGGACKPAGALGSPAANDSIICYECGKCRCAACRSARPLPSAWVCDNACLCSLEACVDTLTCMCCVKAGLYHCGELVARGDGDTREQEWVDHPCSCSSNNWLVRWGCLCGLSLVLPCLLCYPVLKGGSLLAEHAYQASTRHGCTCPDHQTSATSGSQRRGASTGLTTPINSPPGGGGTDSTPASSPAASEDKRLLS